MLFRSKTDIDKYVPPIMSSNPQPQPTGPNTDTEANPKVSKFDLTILDATKSKLSLSVSKQKSYRVYVTAADDFQKVFFETGWVNNSAQDLEVNINGLVCNRELRVVLQLSSELDGKGEVVTTEKNISPQKCA